MSTTHIARTPDDDHLPVRQNAAAHQTYVPDPSHRAEAGRQTGFTVLANGSSRLALLREAARAVPQLANDTVTGAQGAASPLQLKKTLSGEQHFHKKGLLAVDFEERREMESIGLYGTVKFTPYVNGGTAAKKIDLVQIASMTSNNAAQAVEEGNLADNAAPDSQYETSGAPTVKNMWRADGKFHVDLLGDQSTPRLSTDDPDIEPGYNAERRHGQLGEKMDLVTMSNNSTVLDEAVRARTSFARTGAHGASDAMPTTTTRRIDQQPGYSDGRGNIKGTELFDFPKSHRPCIASFHTTVDADGAAWGTVKWGYSSVKEVRTDMVKIATVDGPVFSAGETPEMRAARDTFDDVMANASAWTSPEAWRYVRQCLRSDDPGKRADGRDGLLDMAWALGRTIDKIAKLIDSEESDRHLIATFLAPHRAMLLLVRDALIDEKLDPDGLVAKLEAAYDESQ